MSKIKIILAAVLAALTTYAYADVVTLHWTPPLTNSDTTAIVDLASFNVYARADNNFVKGSDIITNLSNGVISAPIAGQEYAAQIDVAEGTWLTVTALDASGNESGFATAIQYVDGAVFDIPDAPGTLYITKP